MAIFTDSWRAGGIGRGAYILQSRATDEIPLIARGFAGQTANIFAVQNSAGINLFTVDPSGNLSVAGTITVTVNEAVTGDATVTGNLAVTGTSMLTGAVTMSSTLTATGNIITTGSFQATNNLTLGGISSVAASHLRLRTAAPSNVGSNGILYGLAGDASTTELWYRDAAGNDVQITDAGALEGASLFWEDDEYIRMGNVAATPDVRLGWNTTQTVDAWYFGTADAQNVLLIAENGDRAFDFAHGAQTNPTLFIHSAVQSTTQWLSFTHNQTNGLILTGAGDLFIQPAGNDVSIRDTTNARGIDLRTTAAGTQSIVTTAGVLSLVATGASIQVNPGSGLFSNVFGDAGTANVFQSLHADNTDTGSHARFHAVSGGGSGGDPYIEFQVTGAGVWSAGLDNSASDTFVISAAATLGTSDQLTLTSGGVAILADVESGITARANGVFRPANVATGGAGNVVGADLTIAAGLGTGTGDEGTIIFSLPIQVGAGDIIQTTATRLTLDMAGSATVLTMAAAQAMTVSSTAGVITLDAPDGILLQDSSVTALSVTSDGTNATWTAAASDNIIIQTTTAGTITFGIGGTAEMILNATELTPAVNAGSSLGTGLISWNGLFLVAGTSINWGNGNVILATGGTNSSEITWTGGMTFTWTEEAGTTGVPTFLTYTEAAHTGLTAATENIGVNFNLSATKTWVAGAGPLATQREFIIQPPTYVGNAAGALVMTFATTLNVGGPPIAGANMTISNPLIARFGADTSSGVSSTISISHAQDTANSNSRLWQIVAGASGGDAYIQQTVAGGVADWTFGIDNTDSDAWVLAASTALGTTNVIRATSQQINLGSAGDFILNSADTSDSQIVVQNQTISRTVAGAAMRISPTFAASDTGNSVLSLIGTQNGANSVGFNGLIIGLTKATGATVLAEMQGIEIGIPGITGTVTDMKGIQIDNQGNANATNSYAIDIASQSGSATITRAMRIQGTTATNAIEIGDSALIFSPGAEQIDYFDSTAARGLRMTLTAAGAQTLGATAGNLQINQAATAGVVFNSGGIDNDFTILSDNNASIFVVDGALDIMSLGEAVNTTTTLNVDFPTRVAAVGATESAFLFSARLTEAASGTHAALYGTLFDSFTLAAGGGDTTNAATVAIAGAPAGALTANYSLFVITGVSRFGGNISTAANADIDMSGGGRFFGGGVQINSQTLAANTNLTMDENDGHIDITTGAVSNNTITLPAASGNQGMIVSFYLEVDGGLDAVVTRAGADVIQNGAADLANTTVTLDTAGEYLMLQCISSTMWQVVVNNGGVIA